MELQYCKWDVQIGDLTGLAPFALFITNSTWRQLATWAEQLTEEALAAERAVLAKPSLLSELALPRALRQLLRSGAAAPTPAAARVMRFDFHPTTQGWRISEVNSDVPGGYIEATHFAALIASHYPEARLPRDPTARVVEALLSAASTVGSVALLCAPGHMEDQQVVSHIARHLAIRGIATVQVSPHQLHWVMGHAELATGGSRQRIGAIFRFFQAEWLAQLPQRKTWEPLFIGGKTPVVNPGLAVLSESKRLPLLWDHLALPMTTWRRLLPETRAPQDASWHRDDSWLLKQAYCNTGDHVYIRPLMTKRAWSWLRWQLCWHADRWVAQRRFEAVPVDSPVGPLFPCIGIYTVDGQAAGVYARASPHRIIDGTAMDIAVLIGT
jgi:glutathionylspermidine synthase